MYALCDSLLSTEESQRCKKLLQRRVRRKGSQPGANAAGVGELCKPNMHAIGKVVSTLVEAVLSSFKFAGKADPHGMLNLLLGNWQHFNVRHGASAVACTACLFCRQDGQLL